MQFSPVSVNARKTSDGVVSNSIIYFTSQVPHDPSSPAPLKLRKILDMVSFYSPCVQSYAIDSYSVVKSY